MRTSDDVYGADAGSEERGLKEKEVNDAERGSQRSSTKEEPDYDSDSSSSATRNLYTDQQQGELLRKLDSLKGHLLRGGNPKDSSPRMGFHGHPPPYYTPYPPDPFPYPMYPSPYGFPMHNRPHTWYPPPPPPPPPPYPLPQGHYVDIGPDIFDPHLHDPRFFPAPAPTRYGDVPHTPVLHHVAAVRGHHSRRPSEIESDTAAPPFVQKAVPDADSRRCHPLAGGAPFIACHNCFELLYLPKKKLLAPEKQQQLQCGACSELISFTFVHKELVFSSSAPLEATNRLSLEVEQTTTVVEDSPLKDEEPIIDRETNVVQAISPGEHSDDDDETSSVSSESQKQVVRSVRRRVKGTKVPPPENSNLLELFEYSNVNRAALTYGMAQLGYNKQESYARQDSLKPESVATETDVSYNDGYYNNTQVSQDSRMSKSSEEDVSRAINRKDSSEYSYSDKNTVSNEQNMEQLEVWVNGHLIPEDLVISAEKLAGPVQAGNYWYDYRAGFWGVMGNPCLGIIPPFIEEFSRPMPDNCAAGNTGVFVNGRELHERDLELLARRGLPRGKDRSYIVDISGRVLDGDSGEELKSLGKLAPTIDKVKHGFGMRVPRSLVSS